MYIIHIYLYIYDIHTDLILLMKPEMMRIADSQQEGLGFHQQNCHAVATFENLAQRWPWAIAPLGQCAELAEGQNQRHSN